MNPNLAHLHPYPFERIRKLVEDVPAADTHPIALSLGEPRHAAPPFVTDLLTDQEVVTRSLGTYPASRGTDALREAIATWVKGRFNAEVDPHQQVLPVNGTREALFAFAQAVLSGNAGAKVIMPNPFYQIYEGATLLAGGTPVYLPNDPDSGYQQDFGSIDAATWDATELLYICTPGNPTGHTMDLSQLQQLIELAHRHDFVIASDECYSEIYFDNTNPPVGLLQACQAAGNTGFDRCVVFHSLSKRSNLPGLRSGFVAGDAQVIAGFAKYRTYHGCAMSVHHQEASALAWSDEEHVQANRALYQHKFAEVTKILAPHYPLDQPAGGFYHWLRTPVDDLTFTRELRRRHNVAVVPGRFLARGAHGKNPGEHHVRVAWVASVDECTEGALRLAQFAEDLR